MELSTTSEAAYYFGNRRAHEIDSHLEKSFTSILLPSLIRPLGIRQQHLKRVICYATNTLIDISM